MRTWWGQGVKKTIIRVDDDVLYEWSLRPVCWNITREIWDFFLISRMSWKVELRFSLAGNATDGWRRWNCWKDIWRLFTARWGMRTRRFGNIAAISVLNDSTRKAIYRVMKPAIPRRKPSDVPSAPRRLKGWGHWKLITKVSTTMRVVRTREENPK